MGGGFALRTNPAFADWVGKLLAGKPVRLSRAMLETLSIVAYRQPITRPEIDDIRGVDCGPVLKTLLDRNLMRIIGKKEEVGRPMLYGTTPEFLRIFSLKDLTQLPTLRAVPRAVGRAPGQGRRRTRRRRHGRGRGAPPLLDTPAGLAAPLTRRRAAPSLDPEEDDGLLDRAGGGRGRRQPRRRTRCTPRRAAESGERTDCRPTRPSLACGCKSFSPRAGWPRGAGPRS